MGPKSEKPLRLFVNPFTIWTHLAFKTGEAMLASAHAAAVRRPLGRAKASKVAVIPTADAPPRKAQAPVRQASKAARSKATRAKVRRKAKAKRRAMR
jgi:hypothetical protein